MDHLSPLWVPRIHVILTSALTAFRFVFSDFEIMHKQLKTLYPMLIGDLTLPPKKVSDALG
jgi:hypothetical protein